MTLLKRRALALVASLASLSAAPVALVAAIVMVVSALAFTTACELANAAAPTPPPLSAEAYCAATFPSVGYGNFFYCGTTRSNLDVVTFPDGAHGFCQTAQTNNIGLVGYVIYTSNGGIGFVESQGDASTHCNLLGNLCPGYIRCTRQ
jgi:hypothetical protein